MVASASGICAMLGSSEARYSVATRTARFVAVAGHHTSAVLFSAARRTVPACHWTNRGPWPTRSLGRCGAWKDRHGCSEHGGDQEFPHRDSTSSLAPSACRKSSRRRWQRRPRGPPWGSSQLPWRHPDSHPMSRSSPAPRSERPSPSMPGNSELAVMFIWWSRRRKGSFDCLGITTLQK